MEGAMANQGGEMADLLEMLEEEIPGFVAGASFTPPPMPEAETIAAFVAALDEIVFTFEDKLHLSRTTVPREQGLYTAGRLGAH
jgi:hypothetical protein